MKKNIKHRPCPFCGSNDLEFNSEISHGHGDCGFEGWIECENCGARHGHVSDYGHPSLKDEHKAWNIWDGKKRRFKIEDYEDDDELSEEEKERRRVFDSLVKESDSMSLLEFLNSKTTKAKDKRSNGEFTSLYER